MGLGAAVGNQGPQYVQGLKQEQQQMSDRKRQEIEYRQKAMYQDGYQAFNMLADGNIDGIINLANDRLEMLGTFPDADPSDTMRILSYAEAAKAGDPTAIRNLSIELSSAAKTAQAMGIIPKPEEYTLSPGQNRFSGSNIVASVPETPEKTPDSIRALEMRAGQMYEPGSPEYRQFMARGGVEPAVSPQDNYADAESLRKEFSGIPAIKDFSLQSQAMGRIMASASNPSAAGDLALIFNYMKVLDPGSTVREGEFANAQNAGSIPARIQAMYNNIMKGERLTEGQRSDFVSRASGLYNSAEEGFKRIYDQFSGIADRRGIPIEDALVDYRYQFDDPVPKYFQSLEEAQSANLQPGDVYEIPDPDDAEKVLIYKVSPQGN